MGVLELIALVLFIAWVGGFALNVAGSLIHLLLVIAVVIFLYRIITNARSV